MTWIGKLIDDAHHIHNFVQNHTNALIIYKEYTHISLFKVANTQFDSLFNMLNRLREVKTTLGSIVISEFWSFWRRIIRDILISRWDKNCTPLHCLAHSLNPKLYSQEWLKPSRRVPPHMDGEV